MIEKNTTEKYLNLKKSLFSIRAEINNLIEIENSLVLVKFYYYLNDLLEDKRILKLGVNESNDDSDPAYAYVIAYRTEDGYFNESLLHTLIRTSKDFRSTDRGDDFEKITTILKKEKINPIINKDFSIEDFLNQFDKKHLVSYLNHLLPQNNTSKDKKMKI